MNGWRVTIETADERRDMAFDVIGDLRAALARVESHLVALKAAGAWCRSVVVVVHAPDCDHEV